MLGAQARAAELQAAKSAAMRQRAHREAEDLTIPPESAPVSLTDFARNPLLTKNKGIKAFRPLLDSDFEALNTEAESKTSTSEVSPTEKFTANLSGTAPIAPRAMLTNSDSSSSRITPSRVQAPVFTPQVRSDNTPMNTSHTYDEYVSGSPYSRPMPGTVNRVFGPNDLTPIKQEDKFADIRERYGALQNLQAPGYRLTPFTPEARIFTQQRHEYGNHAPNFEHYENLAFDHYHSVRYPLQQFPSEADTFTSGYNPSQTHIERTQVFADDLLNHQHRLQQQHRREEQLRHSQSHDNDQPYDRNTKMQSFVAAQQAMAKKGKTVLHNPDLHQPQQHSTLSTPKSHHLTIGTSSPLWTCPRTSINESGEIVKVADRCKSTKLEDKEAILRAIMRRNTGKSDRPQDALDSQQSERFDTSETKSAGETNFFPKEVMSDDWCTLRPINATEKQRMIQSVRQMAVEEASYSSHRPLNASESITVTLAREWSQTSYVENSARKTAVDQLIDEHLKCANQPQTFGVIGRALSRERSDHDNRGALKAIARVMATLQDAADERMKTPNRNEYTSIPQYAVDGNAGFSSSGSTLFDDLGFGLQTAELIKRG